MRYCLKYRCYLAFIWFMNHLHVSSLLSIIVPKTTTNYIIILLFKTGSILGTRVVYRLQDPCGYACYICKKLPFAIFVSNGKLISTSVFCKIKKGCCLWGNLSLRPQNICIARWSLYCCDEKNKKCEVHDHALRLVSSCRCTQASSVQWPVACAFTDSLTLMWEQKKKIINRCGQKLRPKPRPPNMPIYRVLYFGQTYFS